MANQISLDFPDETYSSSNKPDSDVVKTDFSEIESKHNSLDTAALYVDGTKKMTGDLDMDSNTIENLKAPSNDNDAARKIDGNPIGTILEFAGSSLPSGYLWCRGAEVSRSTYSALYGVIGTTFGAGDGSTTFNLPDKRDRSGVGSGTDYTLGDNVGNKTVTLVTANLASHTHTAPNHRHAVSITSGSGGVHTHSLGSGSGSSILLSWKPDGTNNRASSSGSDWGQSSGIANSSSHTHYVSGNTGYGGHSNTTATGSGTAFDITDRKLALNYIIKY